MCGRFAQTQSGEAIADAFQLDIAPAVEPLYNITPTQAISVVTQSPRSSVRSHHQKRWGLIPKWAKDKSIGNRLINARSETVASKPSFRDAFQRRRCLIVADGFYEWQKSVVGQANAASTATAALRAQKNAKQPFLIQMQTRSLFAFAGLWERWREPETHDELFSCTILTTQPNELMAPIHNRMPVILPPDAYHAWLDPQHNSGALETLLQPYSADKMTATPVGTLVNNPRNDAKQVQEPV